MKKLISSLLSICIFAILVCQVPSVSAEVMFSDSGAKERVQQLQQLGLFDLYSEDGGFFDEGAAVKRTEVAKALVDLFGFGRDVMIDASELFFDVPGYYEGAEDIGIAVGSRLMVGIGGGLFEPESEIPTIHFLKAIINALGYSWKAEKIGYPVGYISVAREIGLLKNVNVNADSEELLTRKNLVYILYNALKVPICISNAVSNNYTYYDIDENVNLLTYYHDIYEDEGIVRSNSVLSLESGFEPNDKKVIIGDEQLCLNSTTGIFDCLGYMVEYYYHQENLSDEKELVSFSIKDSDCSVVLHSDDIISANLTEISIRNENKDKKTYKIRSDADVFYNGKKITTDLNYYISEFSGDIRLVKTNGSGKNDYDIVIINDYTYDKVVAVEAERGIIYGESVNIKIDDSKYFQLIDSNGQEYEIENLKEGDIIAVARSLDKECLMIVIMNEKAVVTVSLKSDEGMGNDTEFYNYSKTFPEKMKKLAEFGKTVTATLNKTGSIVWITSSEDSMSLGYLVKAEEERTLGRIDVYIEILSAGGTVEEYMCSDKIKIDGKREKSEDVISVLSSKKNSLLLPSDGTVSQVVKYLLNKEGLLLEIKTAASKESGLIKKFSGNDLPVQNQAAGTGILDELYPITKTVPIFRVPKTGQENFDEGYFSVTGYDKDGGPKGGDYITVEGYVEEENDVLSSVMVMYEEVAAAIPKQASLFLVDKVMMARNSDDVFVGKICGYWKTGYDEIFLDEDVDIPTNLSKGDICAFNLDMNNKGLLVDVVYDYETESVKSPYDTYERIRDVRLVHVYNAPKDSSFAEAYTETTGFSAGTPLKDKDHMVVLNFASLSNNNVFTFDCETKEIAKGKPAVLIDYLCDPANYAKVVVRYSYGYPMDYIIYK